MESGGASRGRRRQGDRPRQQHRRSLPRPVLEAKILHSTIANGWPSSPWIFPAAQARGGGRRPALTPDIQYPTPGHP